MDEEPIEGEAPEKTDLTEEDRRQAAQKKRAVYNALRQIAKGTVIKDPKPARNAPCACGSGKKHKHCCGTKDAYRWVVFHPQTGVFLLKDGKIAVFRTAYGAEKFRHSCDMTKTHVIGGIGGEKWRMFTQTEVDEGGQDKWILVN